MQIESGPHGLTLRAWSPNDLPDLTMMYDVTVDYDLDPDEEGSILVVSMWTLP